MLHWPVLGRVVLLVLCHIALARKQALERHLSSAACTVGGWGMGWSQC